eukprot:TRINITY_DN4716_c0_g1_i1.p1 TRINITY_DN4716_c0_g1~~TRINITY_DN4716_c0_g1_i1.p1  ORF type:complete len:529 (+),score=111.46 TRINITY_DN4716_c0_g1_i1:143-1588(+)
MESQTSHYVHPSNFSARREGQFHQLIQEAFSLNQKCLSLFQNLSELVGLTPVCSDKRQEGETRDVQVTSISFLSFRALSNDEKEKIFRMQVKGEKKTLTWNSLRHCFYPPIVDQTSHTKMPLRETSLQSPQWKNVLRTQIPQVSFCDLRKEIEVYELLDSRKEEAVQELQCFVKGLERTERELEERFEEARKEIGIAERVMRWFNEKKQQCVDFTSNGTNDEIENQIREIFFVVKEDEPFVHRVRLEFDIEFTHERALAQLEAFQSLVDQYFDVSPNQEQNRQHLETERRSKKEQEECIKKEKERARFPESVLIKDEEEKEQLFRWLEEARGEGKVKKTTLLFRASVDGFRAKDFHRCCDAQGPTVVVFRTGSGKKAGGYANVSWRSQGGYKEDVEGKSFLFSLDQKSKHNYKGNTGKAIYNDSSHGPNFGFNRDLFLSSNCHVNHSSSADTNSYFVPSATYLTGETKFQVDEYEVWRVEE